MVDILLIQPPIMDFYLTSKRTIPYGLACMASALEREGFSVSILDCLATSRSRIIPWPDEMAYLRDYYGKPDISPFSLFHHFRHFGYSVEHIGNVVRGSRPFLVGISSLFTPYSDAASTVAEIVKKSHPQVKVVMGGHHATEMFEQVMECHAVDFVLRGEGEASMPALAKALRQGSSLDGVPGLVFRNHGNSLHHVSPPAMANSLDALPLPAFHLLKLRHYRRGTDAATVVVASRGCPMRCTYCSVGASSTMTYRRRSVGSVLAEMEQAVVQYGVRFVDFEDENLSLDRSWLLTLMGKMKERFRGYGLELRAMNGLFPPSLDEELISAMKDAGFRTLNLSLGTASPEQAKRFNRPNVKEAFDEAVSCCGQIGLQAVGYIVVGAPGQSPFESVSDLLYLAERPVLAGVSVYYPSPGSADYRTCDQLGILPESFSLMRSTALPISHKTTRDEVVTLLRLGRILNFMKSLSHKAGVLSGAVRISKTRHSIEEGRNTVGEHLLTLFLEDGKIRGMTPEGEIYEQRVSSELCRIFLEKLDRTGLR